MKIDLNVNGNTSKSTVSKQAVDEMIFNTYILGSQHNWGLRQIAVLLAIVKLCVEEALVNLMNIEEAYGLFAILLENHSVDDPPLSAGTFNIKQVESITDYMCKT